MVAKFYSWDGEPINLDNGVESVKIYNKEREVVDEITDNILKIDTGEYEVSYTIPDGFGYLVYEFKGKIGGKVVTRRTRLPRVWDK